MHSKQIYRITLALLITALVWLAAAQSGNAPPTLKIGLVAPFEGLYRSTGYEALFAVKLALQTRNRAGGVNGYRVELVALNDFNQPNDAYQQARALVADPDVLGVVGHFTSETTQAALPVYRQAQLAVVIPWSVDESIFDDNLPGVVTVAATRQQTAARLDALIQQMGFNQVDALSQPPPNALPHSVMAVTLAADAVTAGNIINSLRASGAPPQFFGQVEAGNRQLTQVAGLAADGLIFVSPAPDGADLPGYDDFVAAYQAMAGFAPSPRAILAYEATNLLLDSIEQAIINNNRLWASRPLPRADVSRVIASTRQDGLTGNIVFDPRGARINAPAWIYQISEARYPGTMVVP